jgi:hypothetical protein
MRRTELQIKKNLIGPIWPRNLVLFFWHELLQDNFFRLFLGDISLVVESDFFHLYVLEVFVAKFFQKL